MRVIEQSRIYIVVFSKNYAYSKWCLDELLKIRGEYMEKQGRVLLPVFYGVQPSDVRQQKGSFEKAFANHEANSSYCKGLVEMWREALLYAANCSGFDLQSSALGSESRLISLIVKEVLSQVTPKKLFTAKYPVGLDYRVNDVHSLFRLGSIYRGVQLIGIWGMGGSGKTVIAKALYNKIIESFDSSCFIANVREESQQPNGVLHLQERLISRLLMRKTVKLSNIDEGIEMIKERLCHKKVLVVLDDTDKISEVDALAGDRGWFGPGSIIIITTRDMHLLNQVQVDGIYEATELNFKESLELLSWHSFKKRIPEELYAMLADKIVSYSCGLPLALEVLGAFLFGRTIQQWISAFDELQKYPFPEIQAVLQISYDGLDYEKREIFLDIACFFTGMDIDFVTEILNGCGFSTEIGIGILKDRCLLTIDKNNKLRMHDLIRDMGRGIIRQQFPKNLGKRSRLWSYPEVTEVLLRAMGTEAIEGISIVTPVEGEEEIHLKTVSFVRMHNLRLLQMEKVHLDGSFEHLSGKFRLISWKNFSLKYLNLNECSNLQQLPENLGNIEFLRELYADETAITILPSSIVCLKNLTSLSLKGCNKILLSTCLLSKSICNLFSSIASPQGFLPTSISGLSALRRLNLRNCNLCNEDIPADIGSLSKLQELDLGGNNLSNLPSSFMKLHNLGLLWLDNWSSISEFFPYDVFLNFKGQNRKYIKECISDHLHDRLEMDGFHTFMDNSELQKGRKNHLQRMRAIEESKIFIVIFSEDYAYSRWCLDELVKILQECDKKKGQVLLPVFYFVQPSDVRRKQGCFGQAFRIHEANYANEPDLVENWRRALSYAATFPGWHFGDGAYRGNVYDYSFYGNSKLRQIIEISKHIGSLVNRNNLFNFSDAINKALNLGHKEHWD